MNLAYDTSRCVGRNMADNFIACPDREHCERWLQMARDRDNGLPSYQGMSVMSNARDMDDFEVPCDYIIEVQT